MDKVILGSELKKLLKISVVVIDNAVFRLHYKLTTFILFILSLTVTLVQFFGSPIFCVSNDDFGQHANEQKFQLINNFCWVEGTFTLPKAHTKIVGEEIPHPGVDKHDEGDEVVEHAYYQWVCFVLFLQGCMFFVTRMLWKSWEGGKMKKLVDELNKPILDLDKKKFSEKTIIEYFTDRNNNHSGYAIRYFACEILNFVNVIGQIFFLDKFLGGEFTKYGPKVFDYLKSDQDEREDPMIRIFPRMTKCRFNRYGPSGDVQRHDVLCVLPLNIINEKIFAILWVWFVLLAVLSGLAIVYRFACMFSFKARYILTKVTTILTPVEVIERVLFRVSFGEWFLLYMLGANIDNIHYKEIMTELGDHLENEEEFGREVTDEVDGINESVA